MWTDTKMSDQSEQQTSLPLDSSAAASHAKTFPLPANELACEVLAAVCGLSSAESWKSYARTGWWLRTLPAERLRGLTRSHLGWSSLGTRSFRSRLARRMSVLRTSGIGCSSLLPTLTRGVNLVSPSMQEVAEAQAAVADAMRYGSNQGGAAGRVGPVRQSLGQIARSGLLPTLCARDCRGAGPGHTQGGTDLPTAAGGHLSPTFCEWLMGFPVGWTLPVLAYKRSVTRSSRNALK